MWCDVHSQGSTHSRQALPTELYATFITLFFYPMKFQKHMKYYLINLPWGKNETIYTIGIDFSYIFHHLF